MLEGKALLLDTDMPVKMQLQAMNSASQALDLYDVCDCTSIAAYIKKVKRVTKMVGSRERLLLTRVERSDISLA